MATPTFASRALASGDGDRELEAWGALCAAGFSHRGGDPRRFLNRFLNDPAAVRAGVRVTTPVADPHRLAGSVRVFSRLIDVEGVAVRSAGLGEVATHPDFRGKGVASVMLVDAGAYCDGSSGAAISSLHAATGVQSLYAKYGYGGDMTVPYRRLPLAGPQLPMGGGGNGGLWVRRGCLRDDWRTLEPMHAGFLRMIGATGFVHRVPDEGYWTRWLEFIAGGAYYVLVEGEGGGAPVAYAALLHKPEGWKLADFGVAFADGLPRVTPEQAVAFIRAAAATAVGAAAAGGNKSQAEGGEIALHAAALAAVTHAVSPLPSSGGSAATIPPSILVPRLALHWLLDAPVAALRTVNNGNGGSGANHASSHLCATPTSDNGGGDGDDDGGCDDRGWMVRPLPRRGVATGSGVAAASSSSSEGGAATAGTTADGSSGGGWLGGTADVDGDAACLALHIASAEGRFLVWLVDAF